MNAQETLAFLAVATKNELYDPEYEWMVDAVQTQETIEDFVSASNNYAECTKENFGELAGFKFVAFKQVQVRKGHQRRALSVIDLGFARFALNCYLPEFT